VCVVVGVETLTWDTTTTPICMEDFVQCCEILLVHGGAGSDAQRVSHDRLLAFQQNPESWKVALQVLSTAANGQSMAESAMFISAQLLRYAVKTVTEAEKIQIRDHALQFLSHCTKMRSSYKNIKPVERFTCLAVANAVVHIQHDWCCWKERLQSVLLQDPSSTLGVMLLLEILIGIPREIYATCHVALVTELAATTDMVHAFQKDKLHVLSLIRDTLRTL
jgi:hypothetical protein